ncbi:MAG: hypothetical protein SGARI_002024, partial [Bacillariaceae sp.]
SDHTTVEEALSKVRWLASPPPSDEERNAQDLVTRALAAQRAVALYRTEARLYDDQAQQRSTKLIPKLEQAATFLKRLYDQEEAVAAAKTENQSQQKQFTVSTESFVASFLEPYRKEEQELTRLADKARTLETQRIQDFVELRREAHTALAHLMLREERQYSKEFELALTAKGGTEASEQIHQIITEWNRMEEQQSTPIRQYDLAAEFQGVAFIAPLKGYQRTVQKVQDKYRGDASKVLDLVRAMIVFETLPDIAKTLQTLDQYDKAGQIKVVRGKDRLSTYFNASQHAGGYRDILLNIQIEVKDSKVDDSHEKIHLVTELQLHLRPFLKITK